MKAVAVGVNESKRRMESLEKLAAWQMKVEGWMVSSRVGQREDLSRELKTG